MKSPIRPGQFAFYLPTILHSRSFGSVSVFSDDCWLLGLLCFPHRSAGLFPYVLLNTRCLWHRIRLRGGGVPAHGVEDRAGGGGGCTQCSEESDDWWPPAPPGRPAAAAGASTAVAKGKGIRTTVEEAEQGWRAEVEGPVWCWGRGGGGGASAW